MRSLSVAALVAGLAATFANAIPTIQTKGSKLFTSDGKQFFVKGLSPEPDRLTHL